MKILFIITGSIAVSKCYEILKTLKDHKIEIGCLLTNNAKKLLDIIRLKKKYQVKFIQMVVKPNKKCFTLIYQEKMIL